MERIDKAILRHVSLDGVAKRAAQSKVVRMMVANLGGTKPESQPQNGG